MTWERWRPASEFAAPAQHQLEVLKGRHVIARGQRVTERSPGSTANQTPPHFADPVGASPSEHHLPIRLIRPIRPIIPFRSPHFNNPYHSGGMFCAQLFSRR